jgi:DNA-binding transcriptional MerR regulator
MKINEVEQKVGITKKNIRFYEEKGLLNPSRLSENGYRNYSDADVSELLKIKFLRKLSVPIEEIKLLQEGKESLEDCMKKRQQSLRQEQKNLELIHNMCKELDEKGESLSGLCAEKYLNQMDVMEKGGTQFMNVQEQDQRKKKIGPWIVTIVMIVFMAATMGMIIWAQSVDPMPVMFFAVVLAVPVITIIGVLLALYMRLKEIEGGEENEAAKY